jgi:methyl-accepting chemotaxis protein
MSNEIKKEERSEYVAIYVTPTLKKEFELAKDNQALKETILKQYLTNEKDWLNDELKQIDESTVKYSAKLIGIKDAFSKCQDAYVEEIEAIYKQANDTFRKLDTVSESTRKNIEQTKNNLKGMLTQISTIDFYKIEKMLELINKVNSMSNSEMELMKKLLNS